MKLKNSLAFLASIVVLSTATAKAGGPYHFIKEIPIATDGGWDYLSVDSAAKRLYVSHATTVVVIDLKSDTIITNIADTPGVHGIAIAPKLKRVFISNGKGNNVSVVDSKTLATVAHVETGENPDCILFEPSQSEVYAFNGRSHSATVIDAKSDKVIAAIPLDGKPEFAQADPGLHRVFDNIEDKSKVAVIDTKTHTVVTNWPIAPGESASGMAIDTKNHRLFLGCDNQMMVMMDAVTGKVLGTVPIGEGVDANAYDPKTKLAFASCGRSGATTIARVDGDNLSVVQTLTTAPGARTMALDEATHKIYLATARFERPSGEAPAGQRRRPKMVPGTFKILVYGMDK